MIDNFVLSMVQPWRVKQVIILLTIFGVSHFLAYIILPKLDHWMRGLEGLRAGQLRVLISVVRRTRGLIYVAIVWSVYLIMQEITWPSRSYLIGLWAGIATAWTFVAIAARIIRNQLTRRVVRYGLWAYITMEILGATDNIMQILDSAAFSMGDFRLSLLAIVKGAASLFVMLTLIRWFTNVLSRRLQPMEEISPSMKVLTEKFVRLALYTLAVVVALQSIGFDLTSITVLSGAIGLGIGFGMQKVVSNLVSGIILLLDKSIKPGDVISVGDTFGWITGLGARYVSVVTREGKEHLIPNEDLITGQVINWSHSSNLVRLDIPFGVAYASDPHLVREVAKQAAAKVNRIVKVPAPQCHIVGFGDSSIDLKLRFWIRDPSAGLTNVRGDTYLALWDALKENDIEIPFPRRDVTILKDV
ncbi:MAG: mechanosensitive ion channel [Rhodobacteraceae bacterium]|nr:mechanosensitive ion channel [Paracoccaceae bacterium]